MSIVALSLYLGGKADMGSGHFTGTLLPIAGIGTPEGMVSPIELTNGRGSGMLPTV